MVMQGLLNYWKEATRVSMLDMRLLYAFYLLYVCVCVSVYIYIYIYTYRHVHLHMHTVVLHRHYKEVLLPSRFSCCVTSGFDITKNLTVEA